MYVHVNFSKKELEDYLKGCSSILKDDPLMYKKRAILNDKGFPVPLEEFIKASGERPMLHHSDSYLPDENGVMRKTPLPVSERKALRRVKKEFKSDKIKGYGSMKRFEHSRIAIPYWNRGFWLLAKALLFPNGDEHAEE